MSNAGKKGYAEIEIGKQKIAVFFSTLALAKLEELTGKTIAQFSVEASRIMNAVGAAGLTGDARALATTTAFGSSFFCSLNFIINALFAGNLGEKKAAAITAPEIADIIDEAADSEEGGMAGVVFKIASQILIPLMRAQVPPKSKEEKKPEAEAPATP